VFAYCTGLANLTLTYGISSLGSAAFEYCSNLTSVTVPGSVTNIAFGVFQYCTKLTNATLSNGISSIGQSAFAYCSGLASVTIPTSVGVIEGDAFASCSGLTNLAIPSSTTNLMVGAFAYNLANPTWIPLQTNTLLAIHSLSAIRSGRITPAAITASVRPDRAERICQRPNSPSSRWATRNSKGSESAGPVICTPMGRPPLLIPHGTLMAGEPVRLAMTL
jgi:hypothetical protein